MMRFEKIGSFGLTEPLVGSATSGGMMTACRREGDRFVADAEAIYSYEGTREMNTLIVGKAITGLSAFVYGAATR